MPASAPNSDRPPEPIRLDDHAASQIRFIRDTMEGASTFTSISGWGLAAMGLTACAAGWMAALQTTPGSWLSVWVSDAVAALCIAVTASLIKARALGTPLFAKPGRKFAFGMLPPLAAGAVVTFFLFQAGATELIPGTWLLLYGAGLATGGAFSVKVVPVAGLSFMVAGALTLAFLGQWPNLALAAGFGGLHIVFGLWIAWRHGG